MRNASVIVAALLLSGCVIPRSRNVAMAGGVTAERPKLDRSLRRIAMRQDWERELGKFQTDACDARFCWARWIEPMHHFEVVDGQGKASRFLRIVNVLVRFDADRVVGQPQVCSEGELVACLYSFLARSPAPPLAEAPLDCRTSDWEGETLKAGRFVGSILFGGAGAKLRGTAAALFRKATLIDADVPWDRIEQVHVRYGSTADNVYVTVHFRPSIGRVRMAGILLSPRDTWRLLGTLAANNPRHR